MTTMKDADFERLDRHAEEIARTTAYSLEGARALIGKALKDGVWSEWQDWRRNRVPCPACDHTLADHPGGTITRRLNEADICTGCKICKATVTNAPIILRHGETLSGPGAWSTIIGKRTQPRPLTDWSAAPKLMMDRVREADEIRKRVENPLIDWANRIAEELTDVASRVAKVKPGKAFLDGVEIPHVEMPSFTLPEGSIMAFDFSKVGPIYAGTDDGWRPPECEWFPKTVSAEFSTAKVSPQAIAHLMGVDPCTISPIVRDRYKPQGKVDPLIASVMSLHDLTHNNKTNERKSAMATRKQLEAVISNAAERLERLARFPEKENYPVGTIIGFDVRFDGEGSKVYHYAGVKTPKGWFITGRDAHRAFTWDELVQHWAEVLGGEVTALVVCSEVEELIDPVDLGEAYEDQDGESE